MTAGDPIRWGILATGFIANQFTEDLALVPDATVTAVCSRRQATAMAFADRHRIQHVHDDWADLARNPAVDVVYVATPHAFHHAATRALLEAGKAVLCEKPRFCAMYIPSCDPGYTVVGWSGPGGCSQYACDPSFVGPQSGGFSYADK